MNAVSKLKEHYFTLDWLSFTFTWKSLEAAGYDIYEFKKQYSIRDCFVALFPEFRDLMFDMVHLEHGRFGYEEALSFNGEMMIMTSYEHEDHGVFVTVPSHGLYLLGNAFNLQHFNEDFYETSKLFKILISRGAKFTRLDLCYDDFNKRLKPADWKVLYDLGHIDCRTRFSSWIDSASGGTFYLGKRGKARMLRIYDKAGESHGEIDSIRYEFEMKNEYAHNFACNIMVGNKVTFLDLLDSFCIVRSESVTDITNNELLSKMQVYHKKRCIPILEIFQQLRDDISNYSQNVSSVPVLLYKKSTYYNKFKRRKWIKTYISKALYKHVQAFGYDDLMKMIDLARDKLSDEDILQIKHDMGDYEVHDCIVKEIVI